MLLDAGRPAPALDSLDRFLRRHADDPEALAERGRALERLGRHVDAGRSYSRAIAQYRAPATPDPDLFLERARALAAAGRPEVDEAIRGLDEGIAVLGPLVSLGLYAADLEVRLGRYDAALARIDRLAKLSPRQESYLVRRGAILLAADRREEARQAYAEALADIARLPEERRAARAVQDLEAKARAGLAGDAGDAPAGVEAARGGAP